MYKKTQQVEAKMCKKSKKWASPKIVSNIWLE